MGKYEEALARARQGKPIDEVFPELKESEDERVRTGLIHHLKELREWKAGSMSPIKVKEHYDAWIAYLEKQKEEKGQNEGQKIVEYPAKCAPDVTVSDDERAKEGERIRKGLIEIFNSALGQDFLQRKAGLDRDKVIAYLEKQKEQKYTNSENPKEWSNEDLKMIGLAISFIEQVTACDYLLGVNKLDVIAWLKALRSGTIQNKTPHWKPSEEQLTELRHAISGCSYDIEPLEELEEHLKKLM